MKAKRSFLWCAVVLLSAGILFLLERGEPARPRSPVTRSPPVVSRPPGSGAPSPQRASPATEVALAEGAWVRVTDSAGTPLPDAWLSPIAAEGGSLRRRTFRGAERILVPRGLRELIARCDGYVPAHVSLPQTAGANASEHVVALARAGTLRVEVTSAAGAAVAGCAIRLLPPFGSAADDGSAEGLPLAFWQHWEDVSANIVRDLAGGLKASPGYRAARRQRLLGSDERHATLERSAGGRPEVDDVYYLLATPWERTTGTNGVVHFPMLPARDGYRIGVLVDRTVEIQPVFVPRAGSPPSHLSAELTVAATETTTARVVVQPRTSISGRFVFPAGGGEADARLALHRFVDPDGRVRRTEVEARCDADGRFHLDSVSGDEEKEIELVARVEDAGTAHYWFAHARFFCAPGTHTELGDVVTRGGDTLFGVVYLRLDGERAADLAAAADYFVGGQAPTEVRLRLEGPRAALPFYPTLEARLATPFLLHGMGAAREVHVHPHQWRAAVPGVELRLPHGPRAGAEDGAVELPIDLFRVVRARFELEFPVPVEARLRLVAYDGLGHRHEQTLRVGGGKGYYAATNTMAPGECHVAAYTTLEDGEGPEGRASYCFLGTVTVGAAAGGAGASPAIPLRMQPGASLEIEVAGERRPRALSVAPLRWHEQGLYAGYTAVLGEDGRAFVIGLPPHERVSVSGTVVETGAAGKTVRVRVERAD